jgi:hypothetical protein
MIKSHEIKAEILGYRRTKRNSGKVDDQKDPDYKYKPKKPKKKMKKVLSFVKRAGSLIAGVVTGGGTFAAGFDIETSVIVGACAIMVVLGVEMAVVKEFKQLFEKDDESNK